MGFISRGSATPSSPLCRSCITVIPTRYYKKIGNISLDLLFGNLSIQLGDQNPLIQALSHLIYRPDPRASLMRRDSDFDRVFVVSCAAHVVRSSSTGVRGTSVSIDIIGETSVGRRLH